MFDLTCATTLSEDTVKVVLVSSTLMLFFLNKIGLRTFEPVAATCTTESPFETYADEVSGSCNSKSSASVYKMYSGTLTFELDDADRNDLALTPVTDALEDGEYVPFVVFTDQLSEVERIKRTDFATVVLSPQNGHVAEVRASIGVMSMSPTFPDHASASSCGFSPEKEKDHTFATRSMLT